MKNLLLLIIIILIFQTNLFGQNTDQIKSCLDSINIIIDNLPKTTDFRDDTRFKLKYNKNCKKIEITEQYFEKNSNKAKTNHNVFTFNLSDIDSKFILLENFETDYFYIQLLTINNKPKIKQQVFVDGDVGTASLQDRVTIGYWTNEHRNEGELIQSLFISAIKEMQGKKSNLKTSTQAGQLNELVILTKDGKKHKFDIPKVDPYEEPRYLYGFTDVLPSFQGSKDRNETEKKLEEYFEKKIKENKTKDKGMVYIQFTIDKTGKPTQINVVHGVNNKLDQLAVDYIKQMPDWEPGQHKGKNVLVTYTTGIKF